MLNGWQLVLNLTFSFLQLRSWTRLSMNHLIS
jgi:hypothetical protein